MDELISDIYHEKQQSGSMLCAQHALNSLLQGNYFTAPDLSEIANSLDQLEAMHRSDEVGVDVLTNSRNMDDTGFFSVQVVENALKVWGLTLVGWRSEAFRPYANKPELQPAFILNLEQHWFTLRRFGSTEGHFHWFNLNSSLDGPEFVSSTYLGMVLQQSEAEGYSVFAIRPVESPDAEMDLINPLPQSVGDIVAATIPPSSSHNIPGGHKISTARPTGKLGAATDIPTDKMDIDTSMSSFDDEDLELQRALQASLEASSSSSQPLASAPVPTSETREGLEVGDDAFAAYQASMARQRAQLAQAQAEQEMAMRETRDEDQIRAPRRRTRADIEEEEMLQKAMTDSLLASIRQADTTTGDEAPQAIPAPHPPSTATRSLQPRVYDDEDEELQAALKASLQDVPEDFVVPKTPPRVSLPVAKVETQGSSSHNDDEVVDSPEASPVKQEEPTAEEIRRRRLARFGGGA